MNWGGDGRDVKDWLEENIGDDYDDPDGDLANNGPSQPRSLIC